MAVNKDEFFREVTLRICSSLDIGVAVKRAFDYLREYFPLDEIYLDIFDIQLGAIRSNSGDIIPIYLKFRGNSEDTILNSKGGQPAALVVPRKSLPALPDQAHKIIIGRETAQTLSAAEVGRHGGDA